MRHVQTVTILPMTSHEFTQLKKQIGSATDKFGMPIDPGILETVAALRAHGVHTTGSCEGHSDRITGGPYVMFEAPGVKDIHEARGAIKDRLSPEYKKLYTLATEANIRQTRKVLELLNGYYAQRAVPVNQRLIVQYFGPTAGKLMCQGAYLAHILAPKESAELLEKNRAEMQLFTEYLIILKVKTPRT